MTPFRLERSALAMAVGFFAWTFLLRARPLPWGQSALFVPTGLVVLSLTNTFLRAKGLAWGIFTVALVIFMMIVGTWVVMDRAMRGPPSSDFFRSTALYGFLAFTGLAQLRVRPSVKGETSR